MLPSVGGMQVRLCAASRQFGMHTCGFGMLGMFFVERIGDQRGSDELATEHEDVVHETHVILSITSKVPHTVISRSTQITLIMQ
jgi:hypothetical protein